MPRRQTRSFPGTCEPDPRSSWDITHSRTTVARRENCCGRNPAENPDAQDYKVLQRFAIAVNHPLRRWMRSPARHDPLHHIGSASGGPVKKYHNIAAPHLAIGKHGPIAEVLGQLDAVHKNRSRSAACSNRTGGISTPAHKRDDEQSVTAPRQRSQKLYRGSRGFFDVVFCLVIFFPNVPIHPCLRSSGSLAVSVTLFTTRSVGSNA